jgi:hypothetical protein
VCRRALDRRWPDAPGIFVRGFYTIPDRPCPACNSSTHKTTTSKECPQHIPREPASTTTDARLGTDGQSAVGTATRKRQRDASPSYDQNKAYRESIDALIVAHIARLDTQGHSACAARARELLEDVRALPASSAPLASRGVRAPADLQGRIDAWPGPAHASADPQLCAEIRRMLRECLALLSNASPSGAAGPRGGVVLSLIFERAAVLCIGIDRYDACACLAKAVSDAEAMASAFRKAYGEPQYEDTIEAPASAGLGHASIEEAMLAFAAELKQRYSNERELVAVYVAGHGMQQDGKVYLLPSDVSSEAPLASECIDVLMHVGAIRDARKARREPASCGRHVPLGALP